jgi:ubiquinone/menaquinone biosynthesis C-methylase UbiE
MLVPVMASDLEKFYARHARFYDVTRQFFLFDRRAAVDLLDVQPGHHVFEFGCGTGWNFRHLRSRAPARITGIDLSEAMLERARSRTRDAEIVRGDMTSVQLPGKAERILCTYALSMVDRWPDAVRNMHRHLTPSGTLVILDFHTPEGAWRPALPVWRWWFTRFGVHTDRDIASVLRELFDDVEVRVRRSGYNILLRARVPRVLASNSDTGHVSRG